MSGLVTSLAMGSKKAVYTKLNFSDLPKSLLFSTPLTG